MNALAGRNIVIDPNPATGGGGNRPEFVHKRSRYHEDITGTTPSASGTCSTGGNWNAAGTPDVLGLQTSQRFRQCQEAVVSSDSTVWELNVSGAGPATMKVRISQRRDAYRRFPAPTSKRRQSCSSDGGTLDSRNTSISRRHAHAARARSRPAAARLPARSRTAAASNRTWRRRRHVVDWRPVRQATEARWPSNWAARPPEHNTISCSSTEATLRRMARSLFRSSTSAAEPCAGVGNDVYDPNCWRRRRRYLQRTSSSRRLQLERGLRRNSVQLSSAIRATSTTTAWSMPRDYVVWREVRYWRR